MRLLVVFCDGVGVGADDPNDNAFATDAWVHLDRLCGTARRRLAASHGARAVATTHGGVPHVVGAIDATLGVGGRPQSATGQAALITGVNAARTMGGHYGPWPGPTLKRLLDTGTIFHDVAAAFGTSTGGLAWATGYPPGFFDALKRGRLRPSSLVHAATSAGCTLPTVRDVAAGRAVPADFAGVGLDARSSHAEITDRSWSFGQTLARHAAAHALTWFDAWTTDAVGHLADLDAARQIVARLDAFVGGILDARSHDTTVVLTSDHGNLESASTRHHTFAPVPLVAYGPAAVTFDGVKDLMGVASAIRSMVPPSAS